MGLEINHYLSQKKVQKILKKQHILLKIVKNKKKIIK